LEKPIRKKEKKKQASAYVSKAITENCPKNIAEKV
jgi:hypothetical protein